MRSIWTGSLSFGLVDLPVKVYSATEDHDVHLHQVHDKDGGRIHLERRCDVCGEVVKYQHIEKAYDDGDKTVVLTDEDMESLPVESSHEIDVVEFVPSSQIDPIMLDRSYFLEPASESPKSYVLLRKTLQESDRVAIVQFSLRQKTRLGVLRVRGKVLMLQSLLWDDEVRQVDFPAASSRVKISEKEQKLSEQLVDSFSDDFDPASFTDEYQEQLKFLIDAKLAHGDDVDTEATFGKQKKKSTSDGDEDSSDLMSALQASIAEHRESRKGSSNSGSHSGKAKKPSAKTGSKTKAGAASSAKK